MYRQSWTSDVQGEPAGARVVQLVCRCGYETDDQGSILAGAVIFFSSPPCPDWPRGPPGLYPMGTGGSFPGGKAVGA
jgi:hypothetical protein